MYIDLPNHRSEGEDIHGLIVLPAFEEKLGRQGVTPRVLGERRTNAWSNLSVEHGSGLAYMAQSLACGKIERYLESLQTPSPEIPALHVSDIPGAWVVLF